MSGYLSISPEVQQALDARQAVVAFETTILSFGLPSPVNERVGFLCESVAREMGAVPATVAILNGQVRVGLDASEIRYFCSRSPDIAKVNLQNFAAALVSKRRGAFTVAASVKACAMAGIRVFATGGIGGVHRGYAKTLDISSDLRALAEYPVIVVSAGAKSILDVGATLEVLETLGVPVVGYNTDRFPLFFTAESSFELDQKCDSPEAVAALARTHFECGGRGMLVVTPVPSEYSLPREELDRWIETALEEASARGVTGKAVTPFLLERLESLSGGRTLKANEALIENNARLASRIAVAYSRAYQ